MNDNFKRVSFIAMTATSLAAVYYILTRYKNKRLGCNYKVVTSLAECSEVCKKLLEELNKNKDYKLLGFDCEWVSNNGKRGPVAMLQLASESGFCGLFRLCKLNRIPEDLKLILEDDNILKLGVGPVDDANYLLHDYGVAVKGCLDLRYLNLEGRGGGLAALAQEYVGVKLEKNWRIRCSNWEADPLTPAQLKYAAADAEVAVEIFKILSTNISERDSNFLVRLLKTTDKKKAQNFITNNVDVRYKNSKGNSKNIGDSRQHKKDKMSKRGFSTRKTPLYSNCYMYAPDGELLCSCDQRKAEWYVDKGLAEVVTEDPYHIRLLFEPAGRAMGSEEGRFYTQLKANQCVVCGAEDSYLRHSVVPKEYRKHFPDILKKHQSHDVLLMCLSCHLMCGEHDHQLRLQLAKTCDAPIDTRKILDDGTLRKVQSAAKAIMQAGHQIPRARLQQLEEVIKTNCEVDEITPEFLQECFKVNPHVLNENYEPHGLKVANYFKNSEGGLLELEKIWRENFLEKMKPLYMPTHWSVYHSYERVAVRAAANRVDESDLPVIGQLQIDWEGKQHILAT